MNTTDTKPIGSAVLKELRALYPDSPFLALGQTVFWDEPVKAVLRQMLDDLGDGGKMVVGVHDTDYFAKTRVRKAGPGRFVLLAHNDGTTRDLWSAAGEVSTLFGSETLPTRHELKKFGVPFDQLARSHGDEQQEFIDSVTEAWGWRGLIYTGSRDLIVSRLPLKDVAEGIDQMLAWAFENAAMQIGPACCCNEAHSIATQISGWCREYCEQHPDLFLTDLFQDILPRIYTLLLGAAPANTSVDGTSNLLRLTPSTSTLPRFRFVDLFINPQTRELAETAYNEAVSGSTIYTLDKFGAGALPFDVIVPGRGRGTLRITPRVVFVETPQPIAIGLKKPVTSIHELAELLNHRLGDQITLVGKAVTLVSMLAQEFIFVFNEEGSTYVTRTRQMNDRLRAAGVELEMRPILRMRYQTWDSLSVAQSTMRLPDHLASSFGRATITAPEFAASWRSVVEEQRELCKASAALRKPRELIGYLQDRFPLGGWEEKLARYETATSRLIDFRAETAGLVADLAAVHAQVKTLRKSREDVQTRMGAHFRSVSDWTPVEHTVRSGFQSEIAALDLDGHRHHTRILSLRLQIRAVENSQGAIEARTEIESIVREAELARLSLIRNALLTSEGLPHTNHRPSAWWLPMVDATGEWFRRIVATTQLYTEPLQS